MARSTTTEFIQKAQAVHGLGKYDYSKVVYEGCAQEVTIICSTHGQFQQKPKSHLSGNGCRQCGFASTGRFARRYQTDSFIAKAAEVHQGKYDYSLTVFVGTGRRVKVICPLHGLFHPFASGHLSGCGCGKCGVEDWAKRNTARKRAVFTERCLALHPLLDFSATVYTGSKNKVAVVCPKHGEFSIKASSLLSGHGCRFCGLELTRQSWARQAQGREATLYFLRLFTQGEEFYKVGVTLRPIEERFNSKTALGGYQYEVMATHRSLNAQSVYAWEQSILHTFAHLSYKPTRYFDGATECLSSCEEVLAIFPL